MNISRELKNLAYEAGFDAVCSSEALPLEEDGKIYEDWRREGRAADMAYMARAFPKRWDPRDLMPEAKSVVSFAANFFSGEKTLPPRAGYGRVARYAWGQDYHGVLSEKLKQWVKSAEKIVGCSLKAKIFVDTGPILERAFAKKGGMGFIGKNSSLISRKLGACFFISEVLLDMEIDADVPETQNQPEGGGCGKCGECLNACASGALARPMSLDANKCVSYWTIEHKGEIPVASRKSIGDWIFGCDACLNACPYTAVSKRTGWKEFLPENGAGEYLSLTEMLSVSEDEFREKFKGTPLLRAGRKGLTRNACIVAANQKYKEAQPLLDNLRNNDADPAVRSHAAWALKKITD